MHARFTLTRKQRVGILRSLTRTCIMLQAGRTVDNLCRYLTMHASNFLAVEPV